MATKLQTSSKYKAHGIWINKFTFKEIKNPTDTQKQDAIFFSSLLECKVYLELVRFFGKKLDIVVHPRIKIADFSVVLKGYKTINYWKPDFMLTLRNANGEIIKQCIVEAKGLIIHPFPFQYALCRQKYPNTPIVIVSTSDDIPMMLSSIKDLMGII